MPTIINGVTTYQAGEQLPTLGTQAYTDAQRGTLSTTSLTPTSPVTVPPANPPSSSITPTVSPPTGTTTDTNGHATTPPPVTQTRSTYQQYLDKAQGLQNTLDTKGDVQANLQEQYQLGTKREAATKSYNAYNAAKLALNQQVDTLQSTNADGQLQGSRDLQTAEVQRKGNANLANLAIQAQADQGLYDAAQKTIDEKLTTQFQPIQDQIDSMFKFAAANANDPEVIAAAKKKEKDLSDTQKIATDLHQAILDNGNPPGVLAALDKVTQDFSSGKITASEAQSAYYVAAGKYGGDALKQAQLRNINSEIAKRDNPDLIYKELPDGRAVMLDKQGNIKKIITGGGSGAITNPEASKYGTALSIILGSDKFTKDQRQAITTSINSGGDAFSVIKNQAKNIMGNTEGTNVTKLEVARDTLSNIGDQLADFYAKGGDTGIFKGNFEKVVNKLGAVNNPDLVDLATQIQGNLQIYRNAISGTAYSAQEGKDISSIFPGINKSETLNKAILSGRSTLFDSVIDSSYRTVLGKTYDDLKKSSLNLTPEETAQKSLKTYIIKNPTKQTEINTKIAGIEKSLGRPATAEEFLQAFPEYQ